MSDTSSSTHIVPSISSLTRSYGRDMERKGNQGQTLVFDENSLSRTLENRRVSLRKQFSDASGSSKVDPGVISSWKKQNHIQSKNVTSTVAGFVEHVRGMRVEGNYHQTGFASLLGYMMNLQRAGTALAYSMGQDPVQIIPKVTSENVSQLADVHLLIKSLSYQTQVMSSAISYIQHMKGVLAKIEASAQIIHSSVAIPPLSSAEMMSIFDDAADEGLIDELDELFEEGQSMSSNSGV